MKHYEKRIVAHKPLDLFNLVLDVNKYPEFLPWCRGARVRNFKKNNITADLIIGFKVYKEIFSSHIIVDKKNLILNVSYKDGPFEYLNNYWKFNKVNNQCEIEFMVDFKFKSSVIQTLIETLFTEAVMKMVKAFENRADELYKS